ncbi:MAG: hypothetical protein E7307_03320 [Butyrivibrio sp.]|nr:hypothetical protein [Butyrivibrio sp.]
MEALSIILIVLAFVVVAAILGLRDKLNTEKYLKNILIKNYGQPPKRSYKDGDMDHVTGYYKNHPADFQIDDTTWNDLNMDGVFKRMNYSLSAAGEEYLYYMLRTPGQTDDFVSLEKQIQLLMEDETLRHKLQVIFKNIGRPSRYSIYDYLDYLEKGNAGRSNLVHYLLDILLLASIALCFFNFGIGFICVLAVMAVNIISYFRIKSDVDPYLVTYGYIMRVIKSIDRFSGIKNDEFKADIDELKDISREFNAFNVGSSIVMAPMGGGTGSGNPLDLLLDYIRMVTHIDLIKFNQMFREIMKKKDRLDKILEITGRIDAETSIACFRASFEGKYVLPEFTGDEYKGKELCHPLISEPVANDISVKSGVLLTGSNASGKSTFLKTCAINTIMAQSIHTVLGKEYVAPFYRIYSSMALKDDIFEGDSYYIVEIKSIKRILDAAAKEGNKVLCFVDEVLRGTNTVERIAASTQILKRFADANVLCFAATHDIELTALLHDDFELYHFEGTVTDNDVKFDYRIKTGPATNRNAIKLLKVLGYEDSIVEDAQKMADDFLSTGTWKKI